MIKRFIAWLKADDAKDSVKDCEYHKDKGCPHVEGYLCDMKTCPILKEHKREKSCTT